MPERTRAHNDNEDRGNNTRASRRGTVVPPKAGSGACIAGAGPIASSGVAERLVVGARRAPIGRNGHRRYMIAESSFIEAHLSRQLGTKLSSDSTT
jgi:hypothetical protein